MSFSYLFYNIYNSLYGETPDSLLEKLNELDRVVYTDDKIRYYTVLCKYYERFKFNNIKKKN